VGIFFKTRGDHNGLGETIITKTVERNYFTGYRRQSGSGDGLDEIVAFSFIYTPISEVETAYLILDLTPKGASTDEVLFSDNSSVRGYRYTGSKFYGNPILKTTSYGVRTSVTFNLQHLPYCTPYMTFVGYEDVSSLLKDGTFNVVYADDAIIHSARLIINGTAGGTIYPPPPPPPPSPSSDVDEPETFILLIIGMILFALSQRKKTCLAFLPN